MIGWDDALKLVVPFVFAITLIWIKGWYDNKIKRDAKQSALCRILKDEIQSLGPLLDELSNIYEAVERGEVGLTHFDVSASVALLASELTDLDINNSYHYSDLISAVGIVNKGIDRLSEFVFERIKVTTDDLKKQMNRAIKGQSKSLASDFVIHGRACRTVIDAIPEKNRNMSQQELDSADKVLEAAQNKLKSFV